MTDKIKTLAQTFDALCIGCYAQSENELIVPVQISMSKIWAHGLQEIDNHESTSIYVDEALLHFLDLGGPYCEMSVTTMPCTYSEDENDDDPEIDYQYEREQISREKFNI